MATGINTEELFQSVEEVAMDFLVLVKSFSESELNIVPGYGGWTAGQVAEHVTLSNFGIAKQLAVTGRVGEREPDARVENIRSVFLNFDKKLNSPDFILPTKNEYQKDALVHALSASIKELRKSAGELNLAELINNNIFGEISRYELMSFVVFHTKRHIHQLKKIKAGIESGELRK